MTFHIGVLGFQGDIEEHLSASEKVLKLLRLEGNTSVVKTPEKIAEVDALIIPGGESTVMGSLALYRGALKTVREKVESGTPVLGTCAGLISLAKRTYDRVVGETQQALFGVLDVLVERNAFGRQRESFELDLDFPVLGEKHYRGVFIRAPLIKEHGPSVKCLAKIPDGVVAVQQAKIVGTCFHPELSGDLRLHEYFLRMALESKESKTGT